MTEKQWRENNLDITDDLSHHLFYPIYLLFYCHSRIDNVCVLTQEAFR